jgi:4-hydroxy-tetrahydrodipicolinate synthase
MRVILPADRFTGVLAAAVTPVDNNLVPNEALMTDHCKWLLKNGVDGLAILGTTGEANSFSLKERIRIIEGLIEAGIPPNKMMPGTGSCTLTDAVVLSSLCVKAGTRGVLMLPPFYYKKPSDDGLFSFFSEVIQRVGNEALKIYLYHFPQQSATPFSLSLIERMVKEYPNTIVGMKDSSGDLDNMVAVTKSFPEFCVLSGADDLVLPLLQQGGGGCITACANILPGLLKKMYDGFYCGEDITEINEMITAVRMVMAKLPAPPGQKAIIARHTGNGEWCNMRPPLMKLEDRKLAQLYADLDATGYKLPPL